MNMMDEGKQFLEIEQPKLERGKNGYYKRTLDVKRGTTLLTLPLLF